MTADEQEAMAYFESGVDMLHRLAEWRTKHDAHDHSDPEIEHVCLRELGYLRHQGEVLIGSGPGADEESA